MDWISILILLVVAIWFLVAVRYMWKRKGTGCGGCNGDCAHCNRHKS